MSRLSVFGAYGHSLWPNLLKTRVPVLTDGAIRALKARDKPCRVADAGGICIEVTPTDPKLWRYR